MTYFITFLHTFNELYTNPSVKVMYVILCLLTTKISSILQQSTRENKEVIRMQLGSRYKMPDVVLRLCDLPSLKYDIGNVGNVA